LFDSSFVDYYTIVIFDHKDQYRFVLYVWHKTLIEYVFKYQELREVGKHMDKTMQNAIQRHDGTILKWTWNRQVKNFKNPFKNKQFC
jgi:hypothetical protein